MSFDNDGKCGGKLNKQTVILIFKSEPSFKTDLSTWIVVFFSPVKTKIRESFLFIVALKSEIK